MVKNKGRVGTSMVTKRLPDRKFKTKNRTTYCFKCKSYSKPGQWWQIKNGRYRHIKCPEGRKDGL